MNNSVIWLNNPCDIYHTHGNSKEEKPKKLTQAEFDQMAEQIFDEMRFIDDNFMPVGFMIAEPDKRGYIRVPSTEKELEALWDKMYIDRNPFIVTVYE